MRSTFPAFRTLLSLLLLVPALLACATASSITDSGMDPGNLPDVPDDAGDVVDAWDDLPGELADPGTIDDDTTDNGPVDVPGELPPMPPRICRSGMAWSGQKAFADITADSGLRGLGVVGVRLGTVDFDGDGLPDLVVRGYQNIRDNFGPEGKRQTFLLRNIGGFRFEDVTESSGFATPREGEGGRRLETVVWGDVNNDGHLDAFTGVNVPASPGDDLGDRSEVMLNQGDGTFKAAPAGLAWRTDPEKPLFGASFTDFDRDGNLDLWVGYALLGGAPQQDRLYRGDGKGGFEDVTESMGLGTQPSFMIKAYLEGKAHRNTWGAAACDLNGDGYPDLLSSAYGRYFNGLWLGGPDGYTDRSFESGFASDDRDDWRTNLNAQCYCKLRPDAQDCSGVPAPPGFFPCSDPARLRWDHDSDRMAYRLGGNTFTTLCADMNNDGHQDLVNFEIVHWDVGDTSDPTEVLYNDGAAEPGFNRPGPQATGLSRTWPDLDWNAGDMSGAAFDFDNDGRLDLLVGSSDYPYTRAFLFRQKQDGTFQEVPQDKGISHPRSHGVAVADFDGDGDLDVILGHGVSRCGGDSSCYTTPEVHAFRNDIGQDGNFLGVMLEGGSGCNRSAIGAVVRVTAGGGTITRVVGGGYGHFGIQHELGQHFGLGEACDVDRIEVRWPDASGVVEDFGPARGNYRIRLVQGTGTVEYLAGESDPQQAGE
jgi:hypothetical protein